MVVDEFDTFVRPRYNPTLTPFSISLTAISQADVDAAPPLEAVLPRYIAWLREHGLCDAAGAKVGAWCFCTWSDADIGGQLAAECAQKSLMSRRAFGWSTSGGLQQALSDGARGGLRACVERLGLTFDGRAHNGLVDNATRPRSPSTWRVATASLDQRLSSVDRL